MADLERTSTVFLAVLRARVRASVGKAVAWVNTAIHEVPRPAPIPVGLLCDVFRSREELRPIVAFFIMNVNTKEVVRGAVTRAPTEQWTAQQLREATPYGTGPQVLIRDGDKKYGPDFDRVAEGAGIEVLQIAPCTPRMNAACERLLGGVRRECLDHVIILGERHLRSQLEGYVAAHFNTARPHQGIGQRIALARHANASDSTGNVVAFPVWNGLHPDGRRVA